MDLTRRTTFSEGWSWFKFNNLEAQLGMILEFYTTVIKRLKLKVRKFCGLSLMFVEVTGGNGRERLFALPPPS